MESGITQLVIQRYGPLRELLPQVKACGYDGMEVIVTDDGDITLDSSDDDLAAVRRAFDDAGLTIQSVCPAVKDRGSLVTGDEADAERFRTVVKGCADVAAKLGTDNVLIIPGGVTPELRYDIVYERSVDGLKTVGPLADEAGVNLAVEYVWNNSLLSPLEIRRALDEVGHPRVGFYMDTGNCMAYGYAEHWIEILAPHIKKVHVKNFKRRPHWQWPSLLSEGDADWDAIMASLEKIGYDGPLISEMSGTWDEHKENAEFIERLYA